MFFRYLLLAAFFQNVVLTTGFGSSLALRFTKRPRDLPWMSGLMMFFTVLTVLAFYPIDIWIGNSAIAHMLRPLLVVLIAGMLYVGAVLLLKRFLPNLFHRIQRLLALSCFSNVTIGMTLIINYKVNLSVTDALGLSVGACIGFFFIGMMLRIGIDRTGHPDIPRSFRGSPIVLLYLSVLALALLGFNPDLFSWFLR